MKRLIVIFAAAVLLALPACAHSPDTSPLISISGEPLFRIRAGAGGYTAEQRADKVRERLIPILSLPNLQAADIAIRQSRAGQDASIYVRGLLLVTVDRTLASANRTKPFLLADHWANRLRAVLPRVSVHDFGKEPR